MIFFFKRKADFWQTHLWVTVLGKNVKKRRFPTLCVSDHHDLAAAPCTVHGSSKVDSWRGGGPHPASNQDPAEWEKSSRHMRCWSRRCCCAAAVLLCCCAPRSSDTLTGWTENQTRTRTVLPGSCYFGYWPRLPDVPITPLTHTGEQHDRLTVNWPILSGGFLGMAWQY